MPIFICAFDDPDEYDLMAETLEAGGPPLYPEVKLKLLYILTRAACSVQGGGGGAGAGCRNGGA